MTLCFCLLGALTLTTACGDDDDDTPGNGTSATASDLVGTWSLNGVTYVFTDNTLTINDNDRQTFQGTYVCSGDKLVYTTENDGQPYTTTAIMKFLYNKSVLVLKTVPDWADDYSLADVAEVLYKDGKAPVTPVEDIQGTWHWYMQGDESNIRTGVIITGNRIEIIVTPWGVRYVGTFTYKGGFLNLDITDCYRARNADGYSGIDAATLELEEGVYWEPGGEFSLDPVMQFIAGDGEAYGVVANLPAIFVKK